MEAGTLPKKRLGTHRQTFKGPTLSWTTLSKHIHKLKSRRIEQAISWKLIDRGKTYSPVTGVCQLCTKEAYYYIIYYPELATLNARSEIFSSCRHKEPKILIPPKEIPQGFSEYEIMIWVSLWLVSCYLQPEDCRLHVCMKQLVADNKWLNYDMTLSLLNKQMNRWINLGICKR